MESLNLLLLLPFASAAVIVLFLRRAKWLGAAVSTLSAAACFAIAKPSAARKVKSDML